MNARPIALVALVLLAACGADESDPAAGPIGEVASAAPSGAVTAPAGSTSPPTTARAATTTAPVEETLPPATSAETAAPPAPPDDCTRVTDFDVPDWLIVNDGVMGGRSVGEGAIVDGILIFEGTIVTQGGGFSSVRGPIDGQLAGATEIVMRIRTDGRSYELLADDASSQRQRVTHYAPIEAERGDWQEVTVPLVDMDARVFGTPVDAEPFQPELATEIGVILSDGLDGPFLLEIDWIDACA